MGRPRPSRGLPEILLLATQYDSWHGLASVPLTLSPLPSPSLPFLSVLLRAFPHPPPSPLKPAVDAFVPMARLLVTGAAEVLFRGLRWSAASPECVTVFLRCFRWRGASASSHAPATVSYRHIRGRFRAARLEKVE